MVAYANREYVEAHIRSAQRARQRLWAAAAKELGEDAARAILGCSSAQEEVEERSGG